MKYIFILIIASIAITGLSQTTEDYFSRPGLQISAYNHSYYGDDYSKSYSYSHKSTYCDLPVLVFAFNEWISNIYLHIDEDKVYRINSNCERQLLYDFGLQEGDTITEGAYNGFVVETIEDIQLLNGETLRKFVIKYIDISFRKTWIEGIGDIIEGLDLSIGEGNNIFVCARDSTGLLWLNNEEASKCDSLSCLYPRAAFSIIKEDLTVHFSNEAFYYSEFLWDFGNGVTSTIKDPVYEYPEAGCYIATLTTTNDCYNNVVSKSKIVPVCAVPEWDTVSFIEVLQYNVNFKWFPNLQFLFDYPNVFRSVDQGVTWQPVSVPPEPAGDNRFIYDIEMYDDLRGIMACGHTSFMMGRNAVLITSDGGKTWQEKLPGSHVIHSLELGSNGLAWACGSVNRYYRSVDYGNTWIHMSDSTLFIPQRIWNFGDTLLISDGYESEPVFRSCISKSRDNGTTWTCDTLPSAKFDQLYFTSPDIGFGYSYWNDSLYRTTDGGQSWSFIIDSMHITEFEFATDQAGWINTTNGLVYYTTDAMETYRISNCGGDQINYLSAVSSDSVLAISRSPLAIDRPFIVGFDASITYDCASSDDDNDGFAGEVDCDDTNPDIYPGAVEIADNGVDEDCDGSDLITGIAENTLLEINFYPNPVAETIYFKNELPSETIIKLYDITGNLKLNQKGSSAINVSNIPTGIYILEIVFPLQNNFRKEKIVKM